MKGRGVARGAQSRGGGRALTDQGRAGGTGSPVELVD